MENQQYKLSVVLPTYNRKEYLLNTLQLFESQVLRNSERVNFIVSNNGSTDGTKSALAELHSRTSFFDYVNYSNHVDIGNSILRTNDLATGEYILMWGDDDIPAPFLLDFILECLDNHPEVDLIHYNRLRGKDCKAGMNGLSIQKTTIGDGKEKVISVKECIDNYVLDMSFLTTNVFRRHFWMKNKSLNCSNHYGYEFMGHILHGMENSTALYIEYPLCIQRKPAKRSWMQKSPQYRFIGIPNMYKDFEFWGLTDNAKELWMKHGNKWKEFVIVVSQSSMYKKYYHSLYKEMASHQYNFIRRAVMFFFIYICPAWLYKMVRGMIYKDS